MAKVTYIEISGTVRLGDDNIYFVDAENTDDLFETLDGRGVVITITYQD